MKVILILLFLLFSKPLLAQWELRYPNLPEDKITDITFTSDSIGFFVNLAGSIYKTTDGGKSWTLSFTDGISSFTSIQFIDDKIGFAYAYIGSCFTFTTDGGSTWKQDDLNMHLAIDVVGFSSSEFLKTDYSGIYKVTSVFSDWERIYTIPRKFVDGGDLHYETPVSYPKTMQQTSDSSVVVLFYEEYRYEQLGKTDSLNFLLKSNDRGENWDSVFVNIDNEITQFKMTTPNIGYSLTNRGDFFITKDGGENWEQATLPDTEAPPHSLIVFGSDKIYLKANKKVLVSKDSGVNWQVLNVPSSNFNTGYTITNKDLSPIRDLFLKVSDETEEWIFGKKFQRIHGRKIYFKNPTTGWVFNPGSPFITTDGGYSWVLDNTFPFNPRGINFINESTGWIIGKYSISKTTDGGETWNEIPLFETEEEFYNVHLLFDGNFGIIYANINCPEISCGNLAVTTDAGETWIVKEVPDYFESLSITKKKIFGISNKKLFSSSDHGETWAATYDYSFQNLYPEPLVRSRNNMIWVNTGFQTLAYSKDGGENWKTTSGNADEDMELIGPYYDGSYNLFLPAESGKIQKINSDLGTYDKRWEETRTKVTYSDISYVLDESNDAHMWIRGKYNNTILYRKGYAQLNISNTDENLDVPSRTILNQNYPNPFNPTTTFTFELSKPDQVRFSIFNMIGQEVAVLQNNRLSAGSHSVNFDASNLASGTYFYRLKTTDIVLTKKFTLIK